MSKSKKIENQNLTNHEQVFFTTFCALNYVLLSGQNYTLHANISYDTVSGVSPDLLALDVYEPLNATGLRPVIIYVHGGSWKGGNKTAVGFKAELFTDSNYVFVRVNYRLSPDPPDTSIVDAVRFPIHPKDVAKAISVVYENIHFFHGDKENIYLIGHSAGAHLINLVSTNEIFLALYGLSPENIRCACSLDAGVFDVQFEIDIADPSRQRMLLSAFGTDASLYDEASPLFNLQPNENLPDFLLIHQDTPLRIAKTGNFRDSLIAKGHPADVFNAAPYNHGRINTAIGDPQDSIGLTQLVMTFFNDCSDEITATEEATKNEPGSSIRIYPNPSNGLISFASGEVTEAIILNVWGQVLATKQVLNRQIDVSGLPKGMYFIMAVSDGKVLGLKPLQIF